MPASWTATAGLALDHEADVPLGVQLDWVLRAAIATGRLRAGDRFPGLREVAEQLGVNHNTVRAAVAKLEADGLLETHHGSGTFVARGAAAEHRHAALLEDVVGRARAAGVAPRALATALYVAGPPAPRGAEDRASAERRGLREELAVLDRILGELEARLEEPLPRAAARRAAGPRLLDAAELREQRDGLVRRLALVQAALDAQREAATAAAAPAAAAPAPASPRAASPRRAPRGRRPPRPGTAPA